ncbi:MAG: DedA family protein [Nitrospiraceae bacterium]|nr:DedA family protein [Nitrospiraceae bacterium]
MTKLELSGMNWIHYLLNHFPAAGLFVLLVLGGLGLPFPEDATLILCGAFIATGIAPPAHALIASYAGLILMDFFLYHIGRKYGTKLTEHRRFRRIITREKLLRLEERFSRWGGLFLLAGRQFVGLRSQIFVVSGVLKMPYLKFLCIDMISAVVSMSIMVSIGYAGGNSIKAFSKDINKVGYLAVAAVAAFIFFFIFYRYIRRSRTPD